MALHTLDDVVENHIGTEFICRRTLMENLRPGRKYAGCARKVGNRWAFTDDDISRLLERLRAPQDLDEPHQPTPTKPPTHPSGMSSRSKVFRKQHNRRSA